MRWLILSDIHGNGVALRSVLAACGAVDQVLFIGDVVGLGPQPEECSGVLREIGARCVLGDHDLAVLGEVAAKFVEIDYLAESLRWTTEQLSPASLAYLRSLPRELRVDPFALRHTFSEASRLPVPEDFAAIATPHALVGHNHVPLIWSEDGATRRVPEDGEVLRLESGRFCINPGSVGMSWLVPGVATFVTCEIREDMTSIQFHAVAYDLDAHRTTSRRRQPDRLVRFWDDYAAGRNPAGAKARALHAPYTRGYSLDP
jgi:protein phosphatase